VLEGEGVWTIVDGDPVAMRRGDLLLTAAWAWHAHHNPAAAPMVWLDGLDMPLVGALDGEFFEFGPEEPPDRSTPRTSRSESLWAHPGLRPVAAPDDAATSPLMAYRWEHTDAALRAQLDLDEQGHAGALGPGHAAVRFVNPTTGRDALPTLRTEMHRLRAGTRSAPRREVGSSVWQVFAGSGMFELDGEAFSVDRGDVVAVPSWCPVRVVAGEDGLDLFTFGDAPVVEALGLAGPPTERPPALHRG
jgi:gentisate 1,2-dioxygenase